MKETLSTGFRPQRLSELVGQKNLVGYIQKQYKSGREPKAWMFIGETGAGKTTLGRIIALSLQCTHAEFGEPCDACIARRHEFDIVEINASEIRGVEDVGAVVEAAHYMPKPPGRRRVFLWDEAQKLTNGAQNLLLKYFEDCPRTTVWIICTTEPGKILRTLRRRCMTQTIAGLGTVGLPRLVAKALKVIGSKKDPEALSDALLEGGITSPGLVVLAVERYEQGMEAEKAAQVAFDASVDTLRICRAVKSGDWATISEQMQAATPEDVRAIRAAVAGYLKAVLLNSAPGGTARMCSEAIEDLGRVPFEDALLVPATAAVLYKLCRKFNTGR